MANRWVMRFTLLAAIVATSTAYLMFSALGLVARARATSANTAPEGSFQELELDSEDTIYNWDFVESGDDSIGNVDWSMRFIFRGSYVTTRYIKDKLDGANNNPALGIPLDALWRGPIHAKLNDSPDQTGDEWNSDTGIKNHVACGWNWGHMWVYAQSGRTTIITQHGGIMWSRPRIRIMNSNHFAKTNIRDLNPMKQIGICA